MFQKHVWNFVLQKDESLTLQSEDHNIVYTSVSERPAASIFREEMKMEAAGFSKTPGTRLTGIISQKTNFTYNPHEHLKSHIYQK